MIKTVNIKNLAELEFAVFCIESIASKFGVTADKAYRMLAEESDVLYGYIVPEYEILHTQSKEYIVEDIVEVMKEKGIKV